jgi:ABC-type glutathione transport system ATPase component
MRATVTRKSSPRVNFRSPIPAMLEYSYQDYGKNMAIKSVTPEPDSLAAGHQAVAAAHSVDLRKTYGAGEAAVHALAGVSVAFERGRFTAVMGASGSGKSTLMQCTADLDRPTSGQSFVGGLEIGSLDDAGLTQLRRDRIGFAFQYFNLIPTLTAAAGRYVLAAVLLTWTTRPPLNPRQRSSP